MSLSSQFETAWQSVEKCWKEGRPAHAYLVQGAPHGAALRFTEKLLNLVFDNHPQVETRTHPDLMWIEPQSKSRRIGIDEIRNMIQRLSQTSFSGGWKAGVIVCADRMTPESSNAFLKTLEEPPPRTLLILITDEPQSLLTTITSRCQRISLTAEDIRVQSSWTEPLIDILSNLPPSSIPEAQLVSAQLTALTKTLYKQFEGEEKEKVPEDMPAKEAKTLVEARASARMIEARTGILQTILRWHRDLLLLVLDQDPAEIYFQDEIDSLKAQAALCTRSEAFRRLAEIEKVGRQLDRNLPAELVFNGFVSQLVPTHAVA
jgi:DNA polymerase-3 subunit delta'